MKLEARLLALSRPVKQALLVVVSLLILSLLLGFETGSSSPFLYIGF